MMDKKINTESQDLLFELNTFYRDNYRRTMRLLTFMIVICIGLSCTLTWMSLDREKPDYYAALTTGEVIPLHPLSEPVLTNKFVMQWAGMTATSIFNLSFSDYQQQLQSLRAAFSDDGWEKLNNALKDSGMIDQIVNSRLILSAVISAPPVVLSEAIIGGRFTWRVQMLVLVTYTSASQQTQRTYVVTMDVQRVPTLDTAQGIQIINFDTHTQA